MADTANHAALYEFIDGNTLDASDLTEYDIDQAIRFIRNLSRHNGSAGAECLPSASEACFSMGDTCTASRCG
jgi:hypothetical protein